MKLPTIPALYSCHSKHFKQAHRLLNCQYEAQALGTRLAVVTIMTGVHDQDVEPGQDREEFHLLDLVPVDCCRTEKVDLETKLQLLEQSLNSWLQSKIEEIEHERMVSSVVGTRAQLLGVFNNKGDARRAGPPNDTQEVVLMSTDDRDVLEVLQAELDLIEKGGYGRSPKTPWKAKSPFQDSLTCINYTYLEKVHPCSECHLIDFVPSDRRSEEVPCHFIPLNESGVTLEQLDAEDDQPKLEAALKAWLRTKITQIKASRLAAKENV